MWLIVLFDLPTHTGTQRRAATLFRKKLLQGGFRMMQYSVYKRYVVGHEATQMHIRRIRSWVPRHGFVDILPIADKTHATMIRFAGGSTYPTEEGHKQLTLF